MSKSIDPYQEYSDNQVNTADPKELILMLYSGAIGFLEKASACIENYKTYDKANENLLRTQDILTELTLSLNLDRGGELGKNLFSLYSYMKKQLLEANIEKKKEPIESVKKLLKELREGWQDMKPVNVNPKYSSEQKNREERSGGFVVQG